MYRYLENDDLAVDPDGAYETGDSRRWENKLTLTHERVTLPGGKRRVELTAKPRGVIRWNTTAVNPKEGAVYSGPIDLPTDAEVTIYAYAEDQGVGATRSFTIPRADQAGPSIDKSSKARLHIVECYGIKAGIDGLPEIAERCLLQRHIWTLIAEDVKREFNERLRARKLPASRWTTGVNKVERLLGKELLVLAWAVENAAPESVPNAIRNWIGLRPEERWWLFNITAAATGFPEHSEIGWRKALRFALTENPLAEESPRANSTRMRTKPPKRKAAARSGNAAGDSDQLLLLTEVRDESSPFLSPAPVRPEDRK